MSIFARIKQREILYIYILYIYIYPQSHHHVHFIRGELQRPSRHVALGGVEELDQRSASVGAVALNRQPAQVAGQEVRSLVAHASLLEVILRWVRGRVCVLGGGGGVGLGSRLESARSMRYHVPGYRVRYA